MSREEHLVRSTTRAIASTVRDVAPLRLESAPDELRRSPRPGDGARNRRMRPWLLAPLAAAVGVAAVAVSVVVAKHTADGPVAPVASRPLASTGATSAGNAACAKQLGQYCHIELRSDDPMPVTLAELFPRQVLSATGQASLALAWRLDTTCSNAITGQALISAAESGNCTQVLRATYVSADDQIMGTIGVVNLATTNEAENAEKLTGSNDYVTPLSTSTGITSKLGTGTGVVAAEVKGHYLIVTWAEFATTQAPTTTAETQQLNQFETDLMAGTANIDLSQRMLTGKPATAGAAD